MVLERTLESPLECEEVQLVHPKGSQSWVFFWRTDAKAETPMLWPPHVKSWLIGKDSDTGRDWGQEEKVTTEDEMVGWHHRLYGCEFEWTPGVGDGQGGLACCDSWGCKESDMTESLNWTELSYLYRWEKFFFHSFLIPWMFISNSYFASLSSVYLDAFEIILLFTPLFFSSHASSANGLNQFLSVLQLKEWIIIYSQMLIILSFIFIPNFFFLLPHVYI